MPVDLPTQQLDAVLTDQLANTQAIRLHSGQFNNSPSSNLLAITPFILLAFGEEK